jgi:hypothetical protein
MTDGPNKHLTDLTVPKLKKVAEQYSVDVSTCRLKKDYVEALTKTGVTEEQVSATFPKADEKPAEALREQEAVAEVRSMGTELKEIAERPAKIGDIPAEDEETIERDIDQALMMKPSFFDIDSENQRAWDKMILGDFYEALRLNREGRNRVLACFSAYQIYSTALSIRASDTLLSKIATEKGSLDSALKTALAAAKLAFIDGHPKRREEALEELEALTSKAYDSFLNSTDRAEKELRKLLDDYESFGVRTEEPRRLLEIAAQAKSAANLEEYSELLDKAREHAERAKDVRAGEIDRSFHMVKAAVAEAKEAGADTKQHEDDLHEARKAFEGSAFKRASELLASIERAADQEHIEQLRNSEVEARQMSRISSTVVTLEPDLMEASNYGMDVQEGLLFVSNTRAALARKDIVAAAKYARRLSEVAEPMREDLDKARIERGVIIKVEDAKCGKCGKEALYTYPNSSRKCIECGHSFSFEPAPVIPSAAPAPEIEKPVHKSGGPETASAEAEEKAPTRTLKAQTDEPKKEVEKKKGLFRW